MLLLTAPRPFDVVLLDLRLPDASGLVVLSQVRRWSPRTKVILMTAYGTPDVVEDAFDLGAFRVVPKPLDMSDLSDLVLEAHAASHVCKRLAVNIPPRWEYFPTAVSISQCQSPESRQFRRISVGARVERSLPFS